MIEDNRVIGRCNSNLSNGIVASHEPTPAPSGAMFVLAVIVLGAPAPSY
ncbi:hypothetical protein RBSWK_06245 [Rhodopirellula baltica SWK14]|uniref:Uncharacterized protein n=1 Tax=Rhodopirellula baltica SWK14 TaxID=993516 RepID=L7C7R6_RHOBT|nr:hypothetical protein RBSWK_06245 [Rhodopirellula baltica SWK14]